MAFTCPHCDHIANRRSSRHVTALLKESYYQCSNLRCGFTFAALEEVVRALSPPATPNPVVGLRYSPRKPPPDDRQLPLPIPD